MVPPKAQLLLVKSLIGSYRKRLTFLSKYYLSILYVFEWTPISWTRYRKPLVSSIISTPSTLPEMKGTTLATQIKTISIRWLIWILKKATVPYVSTACKHMKILYIWLLITWIKESNPQFKVMLFVIFKNIQTVLLFPLTKTHSYKNYIHIEKVRVYLY